MYKQTISISQAAHLKLHQAQLVILLKETGKEVTRSIDHLAYLILDHPAITLTQQLVAQLAAQNVATLFCNTQHLPNALALPLASHHVHAARFQMQLQAPKPLNKQLWKRIIQAKIRAQAHLLHTLGHTATAQTLKTMATQVKSGDTTYLEAQAARRYWPTLLGKAFVREREGVWPNPLLNYGYTILRAATARALIGTGLLPICHIHHHNRYNAYPLADDMMEPYRPVVDQLVVQLHAQHPATATQQLTPSHKQPLLALLQHTLQWQGKHRTTLAGALERSADTLAACYAQKKAQDLCFATWL